MTTRCADGEPPQLDAKEVLAYRAEGGRALAEADLARMKRLVRLWVKEVRLEPERHTVHMWYRVPYLQIEVAGSGFWRILLLLEEPVVEARPHAHNAAARRHAG